MVALHIDLFVSGSSWPPDKDRVDQFFSINHSAFLSISAALGRASTATGKGRFPPVRGVLFPPLM